MVHPGQGTYDIAGGFKVKLGSSGSKKIQMDTSSDTDEKSYKIVAFFTFSGDEKSVNVSVGEGTIISDADSISIKTGWNFISIPKTLANGNNTAEIVFGGINTDNNSILSYNAQEQDWNKLNDTSLVSPLIGYWIYSKGDNTIKLVYPEMPLSPANKAIYKGWNAVGLSAEKSTEAVNAFIGTKWRTAFSFNSDTKKYNTAILNGGIGEYSADHLVDIKAGYWLYVEEDGSIAALTA